MKYKIEWNYKSKPLRTGEVKPEKVENMLKEELAAYIANELLVTNEPHYINDETIFRSEVVVLHPSQVETIKRMLNIINLHSGNKFSHITKEIMNELNNK